MIITIMITHASTVLTFESTMFSMLDEGNGGANLDSRFESCQLRQCNNGGT